jgi:hypothetical protein
LVDVLAGALRVGRERKDQQDEERGERRAQLIVT